MRICRKVEPGARKKEKPESSFGWRLRLFFEFIYDVGISGFKESLEFVYGQNF